MAPSVCGLTLYSVGGGGWQDSKWGQTLAAPPFPLLVICWFVLETSHYFKRIKGENYTQDLHGIKSDFLHKETRQTVVAPGT